MITNFPNIENLAEEIFTLKKAYELLKEIFLDVGPYRDREISQELWLRVRDFFEFDDSE